jgi:hypothetical protein
VINGTMATLILVLSLVGIVGFAGLLILGLRMWGEEQAAKRAARDKAEAPLAPALAETAAEAKAAPVGSLPEAAAGPLPPEAPAGNAAEALAESLPLEPAAPLAPEPEGKTPGLRLPFMSRGPVGQEILRVARDPATGQVGIYIAGKLYANFQDIQNPANEQAFMMAFRLLQDFSENAITPAAPLADEAQAASQVAERPHAAPVVYRAAELPPPELPSMQPFQQFRKLRSKQPPATKFVIKSITEQIEDHLQDKLARTPLARRGVHVRAEPQGNAVFLLDGKTYSSVDEVPDPEVRQAIREAISEWEKKK